MMRKIYFDYIEDKLNYLAYRIESRGRLNLLDEHLHSENFYLHLFNMLFKYNLENLNKSLQNVAAIDLIDHQNKIIIQVSAICTKSKIETSLEKDIIKQFKDYNFKFLSISKDASYQRRNIFYNPHSISFDPSTDIYDITSILKTISTFDIDDFRSVYEFIKKELSRGADERNLDSNLATIINILSKEKWDDVDYTSPNVNSFEIDRKIEFNALVKTKYIIQEYFIYGRKVNEKYTVFDKQGVNKSYSVLASITKRVYKLSQFKK